MRRFTPQIKNTPGKNTTMAALLHCNGSTGSTTAICECGTSVSLQGNAVYIGTPKFGASGISVSSSASPFGHIRGPATAPFAFKSSDFTVEQQVWLQILPDQGYLFVNGNNNAALYQSLLVVVSTAGYVSVYASADGLSAITLNSSASGKVLSTGGYNHWAITRGGSTWTLWVNGSSAAKINSTISIWQPDMGWAIGNNFASTTGSYQISAYFDEVAVWNECRYTTSFAPPRGAYY
jgi:hypothetical protein